MIIAVWSSLHGVGTTASMLAVAEALALVKKKRVLLMQTNFTMNNLEMPMIGQLPEEDKGKFFSGIGLDEAVKLFKSGEFTQKNFENCCVTINDNISLLAGTREQSFDIFKSVQTRNVVISIIERLQSMYDMVIVDTNAGVSDEITKDVLKLCDKVVINLRQNRGMINDVLSSQTVKELTENAKTLYLFGQYDDGCALNLSTMKYLFRPFTFHNLCAVPYDTRYCDAISECRAHSFLSGCAGVAEEREEIKDEWFASVTACADKLLKL